MFFGVRYIADVAILLAALSLQDFVASRLLSSEQRKWAFFKYLRWFSAIVLLLGAAVNFALNFEPSLHESTVWFRGGTLTWGLAILGAALIARFLPSADNHQPGRRNFLKTAGMAAVAAPLVLTGTAAIGRNRYSLNEIKVVIPNLPKDLHGLRIVQISDIHLSPFLVESDLARAVDLANETKAHIAVVTGDLITAAGDPLDQALRQVARLKSDSGVYGCHGNHEIYAGAQEYATIHGTRLGIKFLRGAASSLQFGSSYLNLAGVDYQSMRGPYLVGAEKLTKPGNVNVLLSHNPDVFPVAKEFGFDLTLSGHTHGGQINFEILEQNLNVARFITPYTRGLYTEETSSLYVSTGLGTVGVPVRFGAPPEVALIHLCAT